MIGHHELFALADELRDAQSHLTGDFGRRSEDVGVAYLEMCAVEDKLRGIADRLLCEEMRQSLAMRRLHEATPVSGEWQPTGKETAK